MNERAIDILCQVRKDLFLLTREHNYLAFDTRIKTYREMVDSVMQVNARIDMVLNMLGIEDDRFKVRVSFMGVEYDI